MELPNVSGAVGDLDLPPMPMPESRGWDPRWKPGANCPGIAAGGCRKAGGRNQQIGEQAHHLICNVAANLGKIPRATLEGMCREFTASGVEVRHWSTLGLTSALTGVHYETVRRTNR